MPESPICARNGTFRDTDTADSPTGTGADRMLFPSDLHSLDRL